jgi:hypothetical protein
MVDSSVAKRRRITPIEYLLQMSILVAVSITVGSLREGKIYLGVLVHPLMLFSMPWLIFGLIIPFKNLKFILYTLWAITFIMIISIGKSSY